MIRVGIIGCGKIADLHAASIQRIQGCEIVGACDREELMAKQLCDRYGVEDYFVDVGDLLENKKPDVVHITTPPQSHYELGTACLEAGCHVYMEKPFTINADEAEKLIRHAEERDLKVTVGHNYQFDHAALRMRELIDRGFLGGPPVHLESYYFYNLGDPTYAKAFLGDRDHWVRKLPGRLLHNIISHGISKIAEFLKDENPNVIARGFTSSFLQSIGETDIIDELRVIIHDSNSTTAYFTFSSQMSPILHRLHVYGPKNSLIVDIDHQILIQVTGNRYKSYLNHFIPPLIFAKRYLSNFKTNLGKFLRRDFHNDSGVKFLIESFYRSLSDGSPLPLSYREIILTAKIMDQIFEQIHAQSPERDVRV